MNFSKKKFQVYVDDNAYYMDQSCSRLHGIYDTYEGAYRACRFIVEDSVREFFDYDYTEEENFNRYLLYGQSPWFETYGAGVPFSAFDYAKQYIKNLIKWKCYLD